MQHDTTSLRRGLTRFGKEVSFSVTASLALASVTWWLPTLISAVAGPVDQTPAAPGLDTSTVILRDARTPRVALKPASEMRTHVGDAVARSEPASQAALPQPSVNRWYDEALGGFAAVEVPTFADLSRQSWSNEAGGVARSGGATFDAAPGRTLLVGQSSHLSSQLGDRWGADEHGRAENVVSFDSARLPEGTAGDHGFGDHVFDDRGSTSRGAGPRLR